MAPNFVFFAAASLATASENLAEDEKATSAKQTGVEPEQQHFVKYLDKYLPPHDDRYTRDYVGGPKAQYQKYMDNARGMDDYTRYIKENGGANADYDRYVKEYSAMAGKHPSSGEEWPEKEEQQHSARSKSMSETVKSYMPLSFMAYPDRASGEGGREDQQKYMNWKQYTELDQGRDHKEHINWKQFVPQHKGDQFADRDLQKFMNWKQYTTVHEGGAADLTANSDNDQSPLLQAPSGTILFPAADCNTTEELKVWRDRQLERIKEYVPSGSQHYAEDSLAKDYRKAFDRLTGATTPAPPPRSAADCDTEDQLEAWRKAQESQIKKYVPHEYRHFALETVQKEYDQNLERINDEKQYKAEESKEQQEKQNKEHEESGDKAHDHDAEKEAGQRTVEKKSEHKHHDRKDDKENEKHEHGKVDDTKPEGRKDEEKQNQDSGSREDKGKEHHDEKEEDERKNEKKNEQKKYDRKDNTTQEDTQSDIHEDDKEKHNDERDHDKKDKKEGEQNTGAQEKHREQADKEDVEPDDSEGDDMQIEGGNVEDKQESEKPGEDGTDNGGAPVAQVDLGEKSSVSNLWTSPSGVLAALTVPMGAAAVGFSLRSRHREAEDQLSAPFMPLDGLA